MKYEKVVNKEKEEQEQEEYIEANKNEPERIIL